MAGDSVPARRRGHVPAGLARVRVPARRHEQRHRDVVSALLGIAPLLTVLVALGFGWIGRRPAPTLALVGLTLVAPALIMVQLSVSHGFLQGPGGLIATPACTAAAGLVTGFRPYPGRGYALLAGGGVVGFLALALPTWALAIGHLADCQAGSCDPLETRGIEARRSSSKILYTRVSVRCHRLRELARRPPPPRLPEDQASIVRVAPRVHASTPVVEREARRYD